MSSPSPTPPQPLPPGPPYLPSFAQPGGIPTPLPDDPITAVLLFLFVLSAAFHMTIFQLNLRRSHRFIFSVLLFGFSMARIAALTLRLVWAHRPTNPSVAIAAGVFTAAGVLLLFIVNLLFAQRMVRAYLPHFGWKNSVRWLFRGILASVIACLIMVVTVTVHGFFTLDMDVRGKEKNVQLFVATYLAVLAFLPIVMLAVARAAAEMRKGEEGKVVKEKFGSGSFRAKVGLLVTTSLLLTLGAGFRAGVAYVPKRMGEEVWYLGRAPYYVFNYGVELVVMFLYGLARFDKRFHVPNGSKGPGDYQSRVGGRVNDEEEVFGPVEGDAEGLEEEKDGDETSRGGNDSRRDSAVLGSGVPAQGQRETVEGRRRLAEV